MYVVTLQQTEVCNTMTLKWRLYHHGFRQTFVVRLLKFQSDPRYNVAVRKREEVMNTRKHRLALLIQKFIRHYTS